MTGKTIRIGVIGCGFYAQNHLNAWRDLTPSGAALTAGRAAAVTARTARAVGRVAVHRRGVTW